MVEAPEITQHLFDVLWLRHLKKPKICLRFFMVETPEIAHLFEVFYG
jgi:hypothetical protein